MTEQQATLNRTRGFYDRISRMYDLIADSSEHAMREHGIRALDLSQGQRVLEIGYGTGHGLVGLADAVGKTGQVHRVDISPGMAAVARSRIGRAGLPNVTFTTGDASALCFRSNVFDAVFMSFTLELFASAVPGVLAEVRRVLRDGGRLGVVALAETGDTNPMIDLYQWAHRHWPHLLDCKADRCRERPSRRTSKQRRLVRVRSGTFQSSSPSESTRRLDQKKVRPRDRSSIAEDRPFVCDARPRPDSGLHATAVEGRT